MESGHRFSGLRNVISHGHADLDAVRDELNAILMTVWCQPVAEALTIYVPDERTGGPRMRS